jgi:hypothetical protein
MMQFEATLTLTNIASNISDHTHVVIDHGVVLISVQLLSSFNNDVHEQVFTKP